MPSDVIPEGYMKNSVGHLVPIESVTEIDKLRDDLVVQLVEGARAVSKKLEAFKKIAFGEIESFCELSANEYGRSMGGKKGNIGLLSFDGKYKVLRAVSDSYSFDERLQVAKGLIDECLNDWTNNSGPELKVLVNDAFQVDKQGNVNTQRILTLRKHNIEDPRWKKAMEAISDSLTVAGSKTYVRLYERIGISDNWKQIPLDIASV